MTMTPILVYPPDANRAKQISNVAEHNGSKIVKFTKRHAELLDDVLFGESIEDAMKTPEVSEETIFKTLRQCR